MICIQTLMGCFPPKRLVDVGSSVRISSGVSVMCQTLQELALSECDHLSPI